MSNSVKEFEKISKITELLVEDIMSASDEEILAEAAEEHADVRAETRRVFLLVQEAVNSHGKKKLQMMRQAYDAQKKNTQSKVKKLSLEKKKSIITAVNENEDLRKKITMAARSENDLTETDLEIYLESLRELGVIDEEGNIL